ncbi:MAG: UbiH/UbiF/VisC/COQ6 family ubiquinone biosynthesis hydroxylase [Alphaproteobacteria bacterium]
MTTHQAARRVDVLLIGGGFIGLTLGAALAQSGLRCAVIDREKATTALDDKFDGRSSAIAFGSARALRTLGIWRRLEEFAEPILEIRVSDNNAPFFLHYDHRELDPALRDEALGFIVENRHIRRALFDHAAECPGLEFENGLSVVNLARSQSGAAAMLSDGRVIEADLAIAADGRDSQIRRDAGIPVARWSYPQIAIVCTVAHEKDHRGIAHERFLPAGPFAILPMKNRRSSIVWTERSSEVPRILKLDAAAFKAELERRFGDFLGRLEVVGPRWSYPLGLIHADRYVDRRLALVGDAAHAIHPIAGQGLNLGLRDVAVLAEVLADAKRASRDIGAPEVLARYERWRRFDAFALIVATDGLNRLFSNDIGPIRLARDLGLAAVNRMPALKRFFMRHAMGLVGDLPRLMRGEPL